MCRTWKDKVNTRHRIIDRIISRHRCWGYRTLLWQYYAYLKWHQQTYHCMITETVAYYEHHLQSNEEKVYMKLRHNKRTIHKMFVTIFYRVFKKKPEAVGVSELFSKQNKNKRSFIRTNYRRRRNAVILSAWSSDATRRNSQCRKKKTEHIFWREINHDRPQTRAILNLWRYAMKPNAAGRKHLQTKGEKVRYRVMLGADVTTSLRGIIYFSPVTLLK